MFKQFFLTAFSKEKRKTTLTGIFTFLLLILTFVGIITSDQKLALQNAWTTIADAIPGGDWTAVFSGLGVFVSIIFMIAVKDPKKDPPKRK